MQKIEKFEHVDESSLKVNAQVWQALYAQGKNDLRYPNDVFVRCAHRYLGADIRKVLDYGCGTGANLLHLARCGVEMAGFEISDDALGIVRRRLQEADQTADLQTGVPGAQLPWPDGCFDAVIAWQVLCYNDWLSWHVAVKELDRVLRPGGVFIVATTAPGDMSHRSSQPLGDHLYKSEVAGQEGCVLLIPEEEALSRCFPGRKLEIGEMAYRFDDIVARHWIVICKKDS
jgi:SAM-dependent methyltransferase